MLKTSYVDLEALGISLASDRLGIVIGQLFVDITPHEPYQCKPELVVSQLEAIAATLAISRACQHGVGKTHFTLFPEYGLPGIAAVDLIDNSLVDVNWPTGTIVIGGIDGLTKAEFAMLVGRPNTHLCAENAIENIKDGEWINCAVTWVKRPDDVVERWIQPKLSPAWQEQNFDDAAMYRGKSVWIFRGKLDDDTVYRFCSLICYDWVGPPTGMKNWNGVFAQLQAELNASGGEELSVSWFFVVQRNPRPSHPSFLNEVVRFYDQTTVKKIRRDKTGLLFANSSAMPRPGKSDSFGGTSLVFSKQTLFKEGECQPTYSKGGPRYRGSELLKDHFDNYFRERGACIQSFAVVNPGSLQAGAAGKQLAIERAFVFPLYGVTDPRVPGNVVPASVKWLNDELDDMRSLADKYPDDKLKTDLNDVHQSVVVGLRSLQSAQANRTLLLATSDAKERNADNWDEEERHALKHVVDTLDIFALAGGISHNNDDVGHGVGQIAGVDVDIVAVLGETHDRCLSHSEKKIVPGVQRNVIVVTRDEDNQPWDPREGKFLRAKPVKIGEESKITDPQSRFIHMAYSNLLNMYRQSQSVAELEAKLDAAA